MAVTMDDIRAWLRQKLEDRGRGSRKGLAELLGLNQSAITRLVSDTPTAEARELKAHELVNIEIYFNERFPLHPGPSDLAPLGPAPLPYPISTSTGRRLENIRRAFAGDLVDVIGVDTWDAIVSGSSDIDRSVALQINAATGLPLGYIAFGETSALSSAELAKLLDAALDGP